MGFPNSQHSEREKSAARTKSQKEQDVQDHLEPERDIVFKLSGRMDEESVTALKGLVSSEAKGRRIALDLIELTLVDQDAIGFLKECEAGGIELKNCPAYVRKWIKRLQQHS